MNILCAGLNHRNARLDVRERFAVREEEMAEVLSRMRSIEGVSGAVMLSTCNRVELYAASLCPMRALDGSAAFSPSVPAWRRLSTTTTPRRRCATFSAWRAASIPW